ncbi:malonyl-ACP O-methyltransferase BioC [Paenibacillus sp. sptzw28]|uniref:malonyl-ACP O-methyltransferase BioC n=1 Tax=Paenibacillus sp. sptzw28 TaxID=715179 RepID=UPI001C6E7682|nr:malonyl-ACP O-methyltransferase BioC [Paenibacillus sp. sptzw28]QYR21971.1 malonyl-ACP O-methyltransferase BioC [Paenibacillus sp. sptzw28]
MSSRLELIRRQFNRSAAGAYDTHANVQRAMAQSLAEFVNRHPDLRDKSNVDILEIGCGTGALTEKLRAAWPAGNITALDAAPAMLDAAKRRVDETSNARSIHAAPHIPGVTHIDFVLSDAESWAAAAASGSFDLIVSSACFQWFVRPGETLRELKRLLRPGGILAFTTFGPQTFRELHSAFEEVYLSKGLTPLHHGLSLRPPEEWLSLLEEAGFGQGRLERIARTESYPTVRDFLHSVKAVGASATEASHSPGLGQRRLFAEMFQAYESRFSCPGGILVTYDLLMLNASVQA